jgi:hypothetical protein
MPEKIRVNCIHCQHYYVTWDNHFPKGCMLFGFKSRGFPSTTVYEATGEECKNFSLKKPAAPASGKPGVQRKGGVRSSGT